MAILSSPDGGYIMKAGLCAINHSGEECQEVGGIFNLDRNAWHLASINPDGTGLVQFAGRSNTFHTGEVANHAYGGSFAPDGSFYANFFPMTNGTEAAGFGGIRHFRRGANEYTPIIGITTRDESVLQFVSTNPNSYGVYVGNYAADPSVLPDGTLLISWAAGVAQDYGLYTINQNGSGRALVYDNPGTTELRAKPIIARTVPPIIPDQVTQVASALPPLAQGPYDIDGTFQFQAMNVYFNAPVDTNIISAPAVGSANSIRFFIDHQRAQQRGSFETLDFPILLKEILISPDGSVAAELPANVPLFEQIRTSQAAGYLVPLTSAVGLPGEAPGATHVAGLNFGRPGVVAKCVGCHAGHTMIPVPSNPADAQWTNLAPGATVTYSSLHTSLPNGNGAVDRKVKLSVAYNNHQRYWLSREGQNPNTQWLQLTFPVPVTVRTVRLYNIPATESSVKVLNTTVRLYSDAAGTNQIASATSGALSENGTNVEFDDVRARSIRISFTSVNGSTAGLGEVEVIARGEGISDVPPGGGSGTGVFSDVPTSNPYYQEIGILYANGYTSGCSTNPLKFCPDVIMNRAQAAVFMLRGNFGSGYVPVTPTHFFRDSWVNAPWGEGWAESMYLEGLTGGCSASPLMFCPDDQLTNVQVAVFGLRLKYGMTYTPPAPTGTVFADLSDVNFWGTGWAEQAYADGLIPACGTSGGKPLFCPNNLVSRGFGAYVIVLAKNLTMP
jgi:hypothetical protein